MSEVAGDLDVALEISELRRDLLLLLATRIERSKTVEHLVYRELEIDQVWRLLDAGEAVPGLPVASQSRLRAEIEKVHDYIGVDGDVQRAASALRSALSGAQ